jgi:fluoroquinolone transport system permease protein
MRTRMTARMKARPSARLRRVLSALRWEATLQYRYGFYVVTAIVVATWVALLRQIPAESAPLLMPAFYLGGLFVTSYFFMTALVLLEKAEGTLTGLVVTPLRDVEYLGVKVVSLAALALVENVLITLLGLGAGFGPLPLVLGLLAESIVFSLLGFAAVVRHDAINTFILPAVGMNVLLSLPMIDHFGLWHSPIWLLHPIQPALVLQRAAFGTASVGEIAYGVVGSIVWIAFSARLARRALRQFVARAAGG